MKGLAGEQRATCVGVRRWNACRSCTCQELVPTSARTLALFLSHIAFVCLLIHWASIVWNHFYQQNPTQTTCWFPILHLFLWERNVNCCTSILEKIVREFQTVFSVAMWLGSKWKRQGTWGCHKLDPSRCWGRGSTVLRPRKNRASFVEI